MKKLIILISILLIGLLFTFCAPDGGGGSITNNSFSVVLKVDANTTYTSIPVGFATGNDNLVFYKESESAWRWTSSESNLTVRIEPTVDKGEEESVNISIGSNTSVVWDFIITIDKNDNDIFDVDTDYAYNTIGGSDSPINNQYTFRKDKIYTITIPESGPITVEEADKEVTE